MRSFFWSVFSCIRTEYKDLRSKSQYSVRIQENTDEKNSIFGHFSRSVMETHILESPRFYRFLLNRNVDQFIFIFFKECFFTHSVTYSVHCLGQKIILNFQDFFFVVNGIGSKILSVMPWISQTFEFKSIIEYFLGSRRQIHLDRLIIYINFGSSQQLFSLKEKLLLS